MESKFGIFMISGSSESYGQSFSMSPLNKLHVAGFDSVEAAEQFINNNRIGANYIVLEYWERS